MDYEKFCSGLKVLDKAGQLVPFVPLPAQRWRRETRTPRDIVLKARQGGVSTEEMARSAWVFATVPGATVVMMVPPGVPDDKAGSASAAARVFALFFESAVAAGLSQTPNRTSTLSWERPAGSRLDIIEASRMPKVRHLKGRPIHRIHAQEAAFWEHWAAFDELAPHVPHSGEITIESVANGRDERFWPMWMTAAGGGRGGYRAHFAAWYHCHGEMATPRNERERSLLARGVSTEQLAWYREKVALHGQAAVDQEYPCDPMGCFGPVATT